MGYVIWAPRVAWKQLAICWGYLGQMRIPGLYINHTCRWLCEQCVRINYFSPRCWGQEPFEVSYSEEGVKDDS
jgi:hypothetical protein